MTLRAAAARPDGSQPDIVGGADGGVQTRAVLPAGGFTEFQVLIPAQPAGDSGARVSFLVSPTFVPGAADRRELGAQIDWIRVEPDGRWPSTASRRTAIVLGAVVGGLAGALALTTSVAVSLIVFAAFAVGLVSTHGLGPYAGLPLKPALLGAAIAAGIAIAALPRRHLGARVAVVITFAGAAIQLLLLSHPDMPLGDAIFQAHRFQDVLAGQYLFTSIAPGGYEFPYPIGLYITSAPFAQFTRSALENAALLRLVVVVANAGAAALLYRLVLRWHDDELAAVGAVAAYHLLPVGFMVIATGNLTNAFAQAVAGFALVAAANLTSSRKRGPLVLLTGLAAAAFLSHTSTFAVLSVQLAAAGAWIAFAGPAKRRWTGRALLFATAAAVLIAVGVYYAHFSDLYRETFARIGAETGRATAAAGGRTPWARLTDVPRLVGLLHGWPLVLLAGVGAIAAARRAGADTIARPVIAAWIAGALLFLGIGIVTPVDMRHMLAAQPALAVLAAVGVSHFWRLGGWRAAVAAGLGSWAFGVAAAAWIRTIDRSAPW